jgi:hypothetical protein
MSFAVAGSAFSAHRMDRSGDHPGMAGGMEACVQEACYGGSQNSGLTESVNRSVYRR